jgi:hypothetical protein
MRPVIDKSGIIDGVAGKGVRNCYSQRHFCVDTPTQRVQYKKHVATIAVQTIEFSQSTTKFTIETMILMLYLNKYTAVLFNKLVNMTTIKTYSATAISTTYRAISDPNNR